MGRGESGNCPNSFDEDCLRLEFLDNNIYCSQCRLSSLNLLRELSQIVKLYNYCTSAEVV